MYGSDRVAPMRLCGSSQFSVRADGLMVNHMSVSLKFG